jgi:4-amino-4-deoxy-L-arabinose transferase-like glycosyltransferase
VKLGGADFFEPDEGRNAEKAREILLLNDWVTPHENFLPVLDKPMFFYWLVAFSYKIFGVAEWSARLPSALFALGCLLLVYGFSRRWWGPWPAMWSVLILLTNVEFFLLARIVIFDTALTFCITLALCSFYSALHVENEQTKRIYCLLLYVALAAGTLIKGLIGLVIPGMVGFVYLLLKNKWSRLQQFYLLPGALLFCIMVASWYLWADARNPGYLRYYLWDEHFTRYLTDDFNRENPWFYFFMVLAAGFLPWTFFLPFVGKYLWRKFDDKNMFLVLWVALPFLFFSFSSSKLPQYLLPIYPALALLSGQTMANLFDETELKRRLWYSPCAFVAGFVLYLFVGGIWRRLLPMPIRDGVDKDFLLIGLTAALMVLICVGFGYAYLKGHGRSQAAAYVCSSVGMALFFLLGSCLMMTASLERSAKALAQSAVPFIREDSQIFIYDTYINGLLLYLGLDRPLLIISSPIKTTVMGSPYVSMHRPRPAPGYGKILLNFDEFSTAWRETRQPLLVFAKAKNVSRLESQLRDRTKELSRAGEYVLLSRP